MCDSSDTVLAFRQERMQSEPVSQQRLVHGPRGRFLVSLRRRLEGKNLQSPCVLSLYFSAKIHFQQVLASKPTNILALSGESHCDSGTCANGGSCVDLGSSFSCHCAPGFRGNTCQLRKYPHQHSALNIKLKQKQFSLASRGPRKLKL